jgi:hypothetical protein
MSKIAPFPGSKPTDDEPADPAAQAIMAAIDTLIEGLGPAQRELVLRKVTEKLRPISVPQAGDVLGIVVQLIPHGRQWTIAELKQAVEKRGASIPSKEIYNAVGYLARKKHIQRLGYGRYMIGGVPIVTADEFGGERSITEGDGDD